MKFRDPALVLQAAEANHGVSRSGMTLRFGPEILSMTQTSQSSGPREPLDFDINRSVVNVYLRLPAGVDEFGRKSLGWGQGQYNVSLSGISSRRWPPSSGTWP